MVTSNLPFGRWGETFSDDVMAAAMIDRLVHHAEVLNITETPTYPSPPRTCGARTVVRQ
jgi:DNA replication protein DnaC